MGTCRLSALRWTIYNTPTVLNPSNHANVTACINQTTGDSMHLTLKTPTAIADTSIAGVAVQFPPNRYTQDEAISAPTEFAGPEFHRFALSSGASS